MKQIIMTNIPDIEKKPNEFNDYLKSLIWQFYTDGCDKAEILIDKDEDLQLAEIKYPLKNVLIQEKLPVFMSLANNRLILYKL